MSEIHGADECLEFGDDCEGPVEWRWPGSGTRNWLRCAHHGAARVARVSELEWWADSDVAPDWFDPSYAGERWEDD